MDTNEMLQAGTSYPEGQLAKALVTALTHTDPATRRRAQGRGERLLSVLRGMADGILAIGSRTPVANVPAWVTLEVVTGGFATGDLSAGGDLQPHEIGQAQRLGLPLQRAALFGYYLSEPGMHELDKMLDSGEYTVTVPEEAALLVLAWLLRAHDNQGVRQLLEAITPFADRLRFAPRPGGTPLSDGVILHRETVGRVRARLADWRPNERIAANREALRVWKPFGDDLLTWWLDTANDDGQVATRPMPAAWLAHGHILLRRYNELAATHTRCTKHKRARRSNLGILREALHEAVAGRELSRRLRGLLQCAVDGMVSRRGLPGSPGLTALRARQMTEAAEPVHFDVAQIVAARMSSLPADGGIESVDAVTGAVTEPGGPVPPGTPVPKEIIAVVEQALSAPVAELVDRGIIPSAEVLATLVPQIAAASTTSAYPHPALRAVMAATYVAFRRRRSLLLVNLSHQVRFDELPWVAAAHTHRHTMAGQQALAHGTLQRVAGLAMSNFPGTVLPNRLISELAALARAAELQIPLVEEIAADIFMGVFSRKFAHAAASAAQVLRDSPYARYYDIDYASLATVVDNETPTQRYGTPVSDVFSQLCRDRSGAETAGYLYGVAARGAVIEQSQVLTSHNLAQLVHLAQVTPTLSWPELARRAFGTTLRLVAQLNGNPVPLPTVKNAAYAWRQALFFLSMASPADHGQFIDWASEQLERQADHVVGRLTQVLAGLAHVLAGGSFDANGGCPGGRRFYGWATGGHWMLSPAVAGGR